MRQGIPSLESAIAASSQQDYQAVDWPRVQRSYYLIHQHLRYDYPGPIQDLQQQLMLLPPPQYGDQRLLDHRLRVTSALAETTYQVDHFGNTLISIAIPHVEQSIEFEAWILVERQNSGEPHTIPADQASHARYIEPSSLTRPDEALSELARQLQAEHPSARELAYAINTRVYQELTYRHDVTSIRTTAAQAFALKQGVCQDYAHIMLALCHLCGLSARYVSGHLPGEGGTHAWVEVLLPQTTDPVQATVVPLDPTHGRMAGISYVTIASGSDYMDVAPTAGIYRAAYAGQLSSRKRVDLTMYEYRESTQDTAETTAQQ